MGLKRDSLTTRVPGSALSWLDIDLLCIYLFLGNKHEQR